MCISIHTCVCKKTCIWIAEVLYLINDPTLTPGPKTAAKVKIYIKIYAYTC